MKNSTVFKGQFVSTKRLLILCFLMGVIGLVIIMRILEISLPNKDLKLNKKKENTTYSKSNRGLLYDRNGRLLATNIFIYNLKAYPRKINNPEKTVNLLKREINIMEKDTLTKIKNKKMYEVLIKKNITEPEAKRINSLGIPGLEFYPVKKRFYLHKNFTAHYIGHINDSWEGRSGAERSFNKLLSKGQNINLSIDIRVQYAVREELKKASNKFRSKSATAIIADIDSGEIISLVSIPDFNPNNSIDPEKNSYRNTATLNLYEMGSTFKIFSIAAALEKSDINISSKFDARKPIEISNYTIKDYHPQNKVLSTKEIFLKSSNIGASLIALRLGNKNLKKFYNDLGLLDFSRIDLYEKSKPIVPDQWGKVETATLSFGHGLSITPIQMIEAASLLFNNNSNYKVTIKKRHLDYEKKENYLLSIDTKNTLKELMLENVLFGTAKSAKIEGYDIGGKTATGEKVNNKGKYDKNKLVSSFLAVFPIAKPKYISLVLFDEPKLNYSNYNKDKYQGATGGRTASPVTADILKRVMPILGIPRKNRNHQELITKDKDNLNFASY